VSFTVNRGEVMGLLGPNRAGKTTLVKILLSLCRKSAGQVLRLGRPTSDRETLGRIGYIHENPAFPRYLSASELLEYYAALALVPRAQARSRIPQLLERVGLADRAREPIARYSKGMVQRLALAQALVNDPDLLVLDEPSEGLDLDGRALVRNLVLEQRRAGRSALLVTHFWPDVEQLCDRIAILKAGKLVHLGSVSTANRRPGSGPTPAFEATLRRYFGNAES
jgi:ABC-2 type transport system ATP-binding protein